MKKEATPFKNINDWFNHHMQQINVDIAWGTGKFFDSHTIEAYGAHHVRCYHREFVPMAYNFAEHAPKNSDEADYHG